MHSPETLSGTGMANCHPFLMGLHKDIIETAKAEPDSNEKAAQKAALIGMALL